jgi:hypothetical protein
MSMTDHATKLNVHLDAGYQSGVMGHGSHDHTISKLADELANDPEFHRHVDLECTRLQSVPRERCFVSGVSADFLKAALKMAAERSNAANQKQ